MNRFERLAAEVFDDMMGTTKNNMYVLDDPAQRIWDLKGNSKGRVILVDESACYAFFITHTGNRPEGFHAWLEARS